jgi:hypothetical protein
MRLGIMQPYFFPYLGYFSLIQQVDKFILLDTVQFIRHGWIERNRILNPNGGWQYIRVPLQKHTRETKIEDIKIDNTQAWNEKILSQLQHYKNIAPNYLTVKNVIENTLNKECFNIVDLNYMTLCAICDYIGIKTSIHIFSKMNLVIDPVTSPDEWALNICKKIDGATEYWNPTGGMAFFDPQKYQNSKIELKFQKVKLREYDQKREVFETGLSIIDILMFNSIETVKEMLNDYELL